MAMAKDRTPPQDVLRRLLDYDPDTGVLTWKPRSGATRFERSFNTRWAGKPAGAIYSNAAGNRYLTVGLMMQLYQAHRLIWVHVHGAIDGRDIDHINGDGTDNRLVNLRLATRSENKQNNTYPGVYWNTKAGRWFASAMLKQKHHWIGAYDTKADAIAASRRWREENFPYYTGR